MVSLTRGVFVALAACLTTVLMQVPAHAVDIRMIFGPSGIGQQGGGYGDVYGPSDGNDLTWPGKKRFEYDMRQADLCPGDGLGISYHWYMEFADGDYVFTDTAGRDVNGCGNGYQNSSGTQDRARAIVRTRMQVCWTNDGNDCWAVPMDNPFSQWYRNPNV